MVDSSVWVEFFRRRPSSIHDRMNSLLAQRPQRISTCGIIAQEMLQGLKSTRDVHWVEGQLLMLPWLEITRDGYLFAANLSRGLRQKGVALTSADALIAAVAIQQGAILWTFDKIFDSIGHHTLLQLYR